MIQLYLSWVGAERNLSQYTTEIPAHPCLLRHYSQKPGYGISLSVHERIDNENVIYAHKGILFSHCEE
jgi:hypothetical protein